MAAWRSGAIWFGVAVQVILLFAALLVPVAGAIAVGTSGGFVAGALAGGGLRPGARHGLAAGAVGALVATVVGSGVALTVGLSETALGPFAELPGIEVAGGAPLVLAGALGLVLASGAFGALGGRVRGQREFPGRKENELR